MISPRSGNPVGLRFGSGFSAAAASSPMLLIVFMLLAHATADSALFGSPHWHQPFQPLSDVLREWSPLAPAHIPPVIRSLIPSVLILFSCVLAVCSCALRSASVQLSGLGIVASCSAVARTRAAVSCAQCAQSGQFCIALNGVLKLFAERHQSQMDARILDRGIRQRRAGGRCQQHEQVSLVPEAPT